MANYRGSYRQSSSYTPRSIRKIEHKARNKLIATVVGSILVLVLLVTWGLPALINGLSVFNKLKGKQSVTTPASQNVTVAPPVLTIPYDATNSATIEIHGYAAGSNKVEIYFDDNLQDTATVGDDGTFATKDLSLAEGANNIYGITIDPSGKKSLPSKTIQLTFNNQKPTLDLSAPSDGMQIKGGDKKTTVSGSTDSSNVVTINGQTIVLNYDGTFSKDVALNEGDNTITITATDPIGNTTQVQKVVNYADQ